MPLAFEIFMRSPGAEFHSFMAAKPCFQRSATTAVSSNQKVTSMAGQKPKLSANDFDPEVLRLFDKYVHGGIDRRGFLDGELRCTVEFTPADPQ